MGDRQPVMAATGRPQELEQGGADQPDDERRYAHCDQELD
jgi:hypothetical protein